MAKLRCSVLHSRVLGLATLPLTLVALSACPAKKADEGEGEADGEAKAESNSDAGEATTSTGGTDPEAANAAKDAEGTTDARVDCPEALKGKDGADRVITKACGAVPVDGDYSMEGGTLTLKAGAHLVFADGAKLNVGYYEPSKIIVEGTAEEPVVFESKGDKVAGVWKGLRLYQKANRSKIEHLVIRHAGSDDDGALRVDAEDVSISGLRVEEAKNLGIRVMTETGFALAASKVDAAEGPAIRTTATAAGGIASDNSFGDGDVVEIDRGKVEQDVTWHRLSTPWVLARQVQVNGKNGSLATLTIEPGNEIRMGTASTLDVGYYQPARLVARGTADGPITFTAQNGQEAGSWKYVAIYGKGQGEFDHVSFKNGGSDDNKGMLFANGKAKLKVDHGSFENASTAVKLDGNELELEGLANSTFKGTPTPIACTPLVFGGVSQGNTYEQDDETRIHLRSGKVEADTTWTAQAVPVELDGDVNVDREAKLTVEAGSQFVVEDGVKIGVGYYERAAIELNGTADAPVTFEGVRPEPGTWGPLTLYKKSRASRFGHVQLSHAGGDAAVDVQAEADLKVESLTCTDCEGAVLRWACESKVEPGTVTKAGSTPSAAQAPSGCK